MRIKFPENNEGLLGGCGVNPAPPACPADDPELVEGEFCGVTKIFILIIIKK